MSDEEVVLLDESGRSIGTAAKAGVHHRRTPLHLAFSCYLFDAEGSVLLTRRALHKPTWPGAWTNSFCGHPAPGEEILAAVRRRGREELGTTVTDVRLVLPQFRYTAQMADGTRENEMCPVFIGQTDGVDPSPLEVADHTWVPWTQLAAEVSSGVRELSPWCVQQVAALVALEAEHGSLVEADPALLPPAARLKGRAIP